MSYRKRYSTSHSYVIELAKKFNPQGRFSLANYSWDRAYAYGLDALGGYVGLRSVKKCQQPRPFAEMKTRESPIITIYIELVEELIRSYE